MRKLWNLTVLIWLLHLAILFERILRPSSWACIGSQPSFQWYFHSVKLIHFICRKKLDNHAYVTSGHEEWRYAHARWTTSCLADAIHLIELFVKNLRHLLGRNNVDFQNGASQLIPIRLWKNNPARFKNLTCFVTPKRKCIFFVSKASGPQEVFPTLDINTNSWSLPNVWQLPSPGFLWSPLSLLHLVNELMKSLLVPSFNLTALLPRWTHARKLSVLPHN